MLWSGRIRKSLASKVPFSIRAEVLRLVRRARDLRAAARLSIDRGRVVDFPFVLAEAASPLERVPGQVDPVLQRGKEVNVALAARAIDRVVVEPGGVFSYHRLVGRPSRLRGFRLGLELRDNRESAGVGGGCCQVSNQLYWLAVKGGMTIVERHRHAFDLFPDHQRTVPFGCGATVFYNYRDLRFENPLDQPILVELRLEPGEAGWQLVGRLRTGGDPGRSVEVEERGHRFFERAGVRMRENRICRKIIDREGMVIEDAELAHNLCQVKY